MGHRSAVSDTIFTHANNSCLASAFVDCHAVVYIRIAKMKVQRTAFDVAPYFTIARSVFSVTLI